MNKVIEYVLRAKDFVSDSLKRISAKFKETGDEAEKTAKKVEKVGGGAGGGGKGAVQVLNDELVQTMGILGKVSSAMGKFGGTAAAALGAFKLGWDIGSWINEKVITPLFGIKDPIEELKKHNRQLKAEAERAFKAWSDSMDELDAKFDESARLIKNQADEVNNLAYAYQKLQQAQEKQIKAEEDAQILRLQREKFDAMEAQNRAGNSVGASQLGLEYDVKIAEAKRAQELAKFDRDTERAAQNKITAQRQLNLLGEEEINIEKRLSDLMREKGNIEENGNFRNYDQQMKRIDQQINATIAKLDAQYDKIQQKKADIEAAGIEEGARAQERRNLEESLKQEIDAKKKAHDDFVDEFLKKQEEDEYHAFIEEQEREQAELDKARADKLAADLEAEKKLHAQRVKDAQQELAESTAAQATAQADLQQAKAKVSQAWGWYRNKDSMKAYMEEQKADQEAQKQYLKDFDKLKSRHRDWRTVEMGKLSVEEEATRQVALAKEAEAAAQRALDEISANTAAIRDIYEALTGGE